MHHRIGVALPTATRLIARTRDVELGLVVLILGRVVLAARVVQDLGHGVPCGARAGPRGTARRPLLRKTPGLERERARVRVTSPLLPLLARSTRAWSLQQWLARVGKRTSDARLPGPRAPLGMTSMEALSS